MWNLVFSLPSSILLNASTVINILAGPAAWRLEATGASLPYSKFWNSDRKSSYVSSRIGMLIAYTPALAVAASSFVFFPVGVGSTRMLLVQSSIALHFFKRILEVMFVHRFSGVAALSASIMISCSYLASTSGILYAQSFALGLPEPGLDLKLVGAVLFMVGIVGNFYHHVLLAKLRGEGEKEYKIPKGGLFGVVICPHYLFEMVDLVGISFMSQTVFGFSAVFSMICYLMGRSHNTRKWYLSKFEDFPPHVKSVVPFIF